MLARVAATIAGLADFFGDEWPTSAATWLPGGAAPAPGELFRNPLLAETWERLLAEAEAVAGREAQIEAARRRLLSAASSPRRSTTDLGDACVMDAAGEPPQGRA